MRLRVVPCSSRYHRPRDPPWRSAAVDPGDASSAPARPGSRPRRGPPCRPPVVRRPRCPKIACRARPRACRTAHVPLEPAARTATPRVHRQRKTRRPAACRDGEVRHAARVPPARPAVRRAALHASNPVRRPGTPRTMRRTPRPAPPARARSPACRPSADRFWLGTNAGWCGDDAFVGRGLPPPVSAWSSAAMSPTMSVISMPVTSTPTTAGADCEEAGVERVELGHAIRGNVDRDLLVNAGCCLLRIQCALLILIRLLVASILA
jgi:hypothetical protein